ncbi:hypothetical protein BFV94_4379 [Alteromonas macleodii]|uniref:Uncharacterized protein n=1 Tax=Alteromonas macleodii TaxID=28108 RepID=A0AB36FQ96_ALTMA|nr:hypothetical protein BFV95_4736 [Alteromonas macleodii]OES25526.1 hypothetical protein BFV94_4379 [Alteromonas macleodii]
MEGAKKRFGKASVARCSTLNDPEFRESGFGQHSQILPGTVPLPASLRAIEVFHTCALHGKAINYPQKTSIKKLYYGLLYGLTMGKHGLYLIMFKMVFPYHLETKSKGEWRQHHANVHPDSR